MKIDKANLDANLMSELKRLSDEPKNAGSDRVRDAARTRLKKLQMIRFDRQDWTWEILPKGRAVLEGRA